VVKLPLNEPEIQVQSLAVQNTFKVPMFSCGIVFFCSRPVLFAFFVEACWLFLCHLGQPIKSLHPKD
jgi:hypothetical protein